MFPRPFWRPLPPRLTPYANPPRRSRSLARPCLTVCCSRSSSRRPALRRRQPADVDNILTLPGFTASDVEKLRETNIPTLATLASMSNRRLLAIKGFSESKVCVGAVVVVCPPAHHPRLSTPPSHPPAHPLTCLPHRGFAQTPHTRACAHAHDIEVIKLKDACKELAKRVMFICGSIFMTGKFLSARTPPPPASRSVPSVEHRKPHACVFVHLPVFPCAGLQKQEMEKSIKRITTGSVAFDSILGNGIESKSITEMCVRVGVGGCA